jgi:hypothetical protein
LLGLLLELAVKDRHADSHSPRLKRFGGFRRSRQARPPSSTVLRASRSPTETPLVRFLIDPWTGGFDAQGKITRMNSYGRGIDGPSGGRA